MTREEIIARNSLLTYCEARGWKMRRAGAEFVCRCPFPDHEDRTPSFHVNPDKKALVLPWVRSRWIDLRPPYGIDMAS